MAVAAQHISAPLVAISLCGAHRIVAGINEVGSHRACVVKPMSHKPTILEGALLLPDGGTDRFALKAWPAPGHGESLRWELRRLFPLVGYKCSSHRTKVCNRIREQVGHWKAFKESYGWPTEEIVGQSWHSVVCGPDQQSGLRGTEEQEYWVETRMLLGLILFWQGYRKLPCERARCQVAATTVLQMTCLPEQLEEFPGLVLSDEDRALCRRGCADDEAEQCLCVEAYFEACARRDANDCRHTHLWTVLASSQPWAACRTVASLVSKNLEFFAGLVDENFERWQHQDFLKSIGLVLVTRSGKRRRMDPHAKESAIERSLQDGRADKASTLVKALDLGCARASQVWMEEALAFLQTESRLSFRTPRIVSLTVDAAKVGKPAKEILVGCQYMWPNDINIVLPPQALRSVETVKLQSKPSKRQLRQNFVVQ